MDMGSQTQGAYKIDRKLLQVTGNGGNAPTLPEACSLNSTTVHCSLYPDGTTLWDVIDDAVHFE